MDKLADGLIWYLVFLFSMVCHEAAHAFVALRLGDKTAYKGGQVTLNPIPHILRSPIGTVVVPILSFLIGGWIIGWASTPYDQKWALANPKSSAKMSAAGPAANLILALAAAVVIKIGLWKGVFLPPSNFGNGMIIDSIHVGLWSTVAAFASVFFLLNIILFLFNLLPIPPLDGSGVVALFLSKQSATSYLELLQSGAFALIGLTIAWKLFGLFCYPIISSAIRWLVFSHL
jgi:Zn-dependent protease